MRCGREEGDGGEGGGGGSAAGAAVKKVKVVMVHGLGGVHEGACPNDEMLKGVGCDGALSQRGGNEVV